jgi:serine/threonine-protein kinase
VCRAVAFAHARGVLHRDLKGQNVILGDFGEVFLLDWGLAGTLSGTGPDPGSGGIVGTPGYIAPEVAAGGPTSVASDVYGLGAILYSILTGRAPYHSGAAGDRVRQAATLDPPSPRAINPSAPAALDAVCRKAMARDPADRYPSADALAVQIRRHLADEPVDAYREPWPVRAARWGRRHRTAVTAAAAILVTAVIALAVSTALVWRERDRTAAQKRLAEAAHLRAEENFGTARALALDLSARINQIETSQSNPRLADLARKSALDRARQLFERFRDERPDDAALQVQTASLHRFAANVSRLLGDNPAAESAYAAAVKIWEQLADRYPEEPVHRDNLAETLRDRSMLEKRVGRLPDAAATLDRAMKIAEGLDGELPESSCRRTQGTVEVERAEIAYARGQFEAAERSAQRALRLLDGLKGAPADEARPYDPLLAAMAVNRVAMARREQGRLAEALAAHDDAVKRMSALAGEKAGRDERFWDHQVRRERARTAAAVKDRREAASGDLERLLPEAAKLVEDNPNVPHYRQGLAAAYLRRGELLTLLGRPEPAAAELTKSLAVSRELLDRHGLLSDSLLVRGETFLALARALAAAGKKEEAAARWKDAAKLFAVALKRDPDNHHHRRGLLEAERAGGRAP